MPSEDRFPPQFVIIGVPHSRRTQRFVAAARSAGFAQVEVYTWQEALRGMRLPERGALVRWESPSDCPETLRTLLSCGIESLENAGGVPLCQAAIDRLDGARGEILHPRQWYLGLRKILIEVAERWSERSVRWMSSPEAIMTAFDKVACLERWEAARLPVPPRVGPVHTYAALRRQVPERHARLFIKLRYGYSAMGAVALEWRGPLIRAITTVEAVWSEGRPRLFVSKRPRTLLREFEIAWLIETLGLEEIVVERWLPKARWEGRSYDLRLVMINGTLRHLVGRSSTSPFTNLNLDSVRMSRELVQERLESRWDELLDLSTRACAALPAAGMLGLDVLVHPRESGFSLLEANAFGDYLPGLQHQGETTEEAQLRSWFTAGASR